MELHAMGIDLGKTLFHLVGVDSRGNIVVRKRCSRTQLLKYTANLRVQRIGMEACSGSHFLARCSERTGPRRSVDPGAVCQAVREDE
jgi:transposase